MKTKVALLAIVLLILPVATVARGQSEDGAATKEARRQAAQEFKEQLLAERKAELSQARAQRIVERCERLQVKIGQIADRINTVQEARGQMAANLATRLESFSGRLQAAGLDTTALDEDVVSLKTLSSELEALWSAHAEKLTALSTAKCDAEADAFHEALEAAKSAHADVRAKYKEIKDFIQDEIKLDLQDLRAQLAGEDDTETNEETAQ